MNKLTDEKCLNLRTTLLENLPECQYYAIYKIQKAGVKDYKKFYNDVFLKKLKIALNKKAPNAVSAVLNIFHVSDDELKAAQKLDKQLIDFIASDLIVKADNIKDCDDTVENIKFRLYTKTFDEFLYLSVLCLFDVYFDTLIDVLADV